MTLATQALLPSTVPLAAVASDLDGLYEVVHGQVIEKRMSLTSTTTAGRIASALIRHVEPSNLGIVAPEQTFRCFSHEPGMIRRPDIAFILTARVPLDPGDGPVEVRPDIAVEVVSPNDRVYELDEKLADYRQAGIPLVWVVNPVGRTIHVFRADGTSAWLNDGEVLTGDPVLPGLRIRIADVLPRTALKV